MSVYVYVFVCVRKTLITEEIKKGKSNISIKGERFRYYSKSKERLIYHTCIIKDFYTIADYGPLYRTYQLLLY
jgi:hypothetical protein